MHVYYLKSIHYSVNCVTKFQISSVKIKPLTMITMDVKYKRDCLMVSASLGKCHFSQEIFTDDNLTRLNVDRSWSRIRKWTIEYARAYR